MLGTLMPTFNLTPEENGNIALAQALGLVLASLSAGPLVDNKGKKVALVIGLLLVAIALFALPNAGGYSFIMGCLFLQGFGGGIIVTAGNALAADVDETRRASMMNFLNLFFGLGGMVTGIVYGLMGNNAVALCYLTAGLTALTFFVHATTPMPAPSGERGFKLSEAGQLIGRPALWLLALFLFLYVAAEVGVWNWLKIYMMGRGIPEGTAQNIVSWGFAFGLLIGRVVVSRILIKVPAPTVTLASAVLMAITTYLMLETSDQTIAWIAVFAAGLAMAPVFPTTLGMVGDAFPKSTATAMGIVITFGWIGLAVSSPLIGSIAGKDSANLRNGLLVLPVFSVAMVLVNLALRPMLTRARTPVKA
jgi:fucose permease